MKIITTNLLNRFWTNGVKPIKDALASKVNTSSIVNNLTTTASGKALDARQGKALNDKIAELNGNIAKMSGISGIYVGSKVAACNQSYALLLSDSELTTILGHAPSANKFICTIMNADANAAATSYYAPRYYNGDGLYVYVYPNITGSIRINYAIIDFE